MHIQDHWFAITSLPVQQKQQLAKQERLQRFNQHVEELKVSLRQENAKKVCLMHLLRLTCILRTSTLPCTHSNMLC